MDEVLVDYNPDRHYGPRQVVRYALEQVNLVRAALAIGEGKLEKLPPGIPGHPEFCVLARALSNGWVPCVSGRVRLKHRREEGINIHAAKEALISFGFKHVKCRVNKNSVSIEFSPPEAMEQLISRFDDESLHSLIVPMSHRPRVKREQESTYSIPR
jgi:hypothetical protein